MLKQNSGHSKVQWLGKSHIVAFYELQADLPLMDWSLGILVPEQLILAPVKRVKYVSIAMLVMIMICLAVIILLLTKSIVRPLNYVAESMADIAHGEGDLTIRLAVNSNDEVGCLAVEFNRFVDKIQQLVKLTAESTATVTTTAHSVSQVSQNTANEVIQQKHEVAVVATAVTEMSATVQAISDNAREASEAATLAEGRAHEGRQIVLTAITNIECLADAVETAANVVAEVRDSSDGIDQVVEVIKSVAEQINLLALNAAIEAARVGEQGRGFAVVADEVRSLARQTQESTVNIQKMIENLQVTVRKAQQAMDEGRSQARSNVNETQKIQNTFDGISHSVDTIQKMNIHIATATEEQSSVATEVNQNIINIQDIAENAADDVARMAKDFDTLNMTAGQLSEVVARFKV